MDVFEAMATRGAVGRFKPDPIPFDVLTEILFLGSRATTTGDQQLLKFVCEVEPDNIKALYTACLEQDVILTATAAIVIVAETDLAEKHYGLRGKRLYVTQDCAAAAQNMLVAAHALGIEGVWIHSFDEAAVADLIGTPAETRPQVVLLFGYPDEEPQQQPLKDFRYICNWSVYGSKYKEPHLVIYDFSVQWERFAKQTKRLLDRKYEVVKKRYAPREGAPPAKQRAQQLFQNAGDQAQQAAKEFFQSLKKSSKRAKKGSSGKSMKRPPSSKKRQGSPKASKKSVKKSTKKSKATKLNTLLKKPRKRK